MYDELFFPAQALAAKAAALEAALRTERSQSEARHLDFILHFIFR